MGILLQVVGVIILIISIIFSIVAIVNGSSKLPAIVLLVMGIILIKIGRKIYHNYRKS